MASDEISVISIQDMNGGGETEENKSTESRLNVKVVSKAIVISISKILAISLLGCIPWTSIPRANSIFYQFYWWQLLLPDAANRLWGTGYHILRLATWFKEEALISFKNYLKIYLIIQIPYTICYISSYAIWTIYLRYNHPLPNLGVILWIISIVTIPVGLSFLFSTRVLTEKDFRRKLLIYTVHQLWIALMVLLNRVLMYFWHIFPVGYQFFAAFILIGFREVDKRVQSKLVTMIMGIQDEAGAVLLSSGVNSRWAFFIAIRLPGAEYGTIFCTIALDFWLHAVTTFKIIKDYGKISNDKFINQKAEKNIKVTKLILAELIEGFAPIIYCVAVVMAYYGPNTHILTNVGNTIWSNAISIEDLAYLIVVMLAMLAFDILSALINSFCLWKIANINMLQQLSCVLEKYWLFIAINLALYVITFFPANDVNLGMDRTNHFQWISDEGLINLVNGSINLDNEEKEYLLSSIT